MKRNASEPIMLNAQEPSESEPATPFPLAVAVVGHVNHGKTSLVRALTGMATDRLKEEIERGLSITLGFAWRDYPSANLDFIDAPGHEDFIRAMVAGATGARAVLLVVSAVEGFRRQTWEHLRIASLLGIDSGIIAVTQVDRLAPGGEEIVRADVKAALRKTFLAEEPVVFCSSVSGAGLEALHKCLAALPGRCPPPARLAGAFLPSDRVFTVPGVGAVITGTLQGGPLGTGTDATLQPSGRRVGLRQVQVHGQHTLTAQPGGRVAVSLRGVSANEIKAGEVLCASESYRPTLQVHVELTVGADSQRPLKHMEEIQVLWGARRDNATVRLWGARSVDPSARGFAELRFSTPVIAFAGQRAILRRPSPAETIGLALVLDPAAVASRGRASDRRMLLEAVVVGDLNAIAAGLARHEGGVFSVDEFARLSRMGASEARAKLTTDYQDLDGGLMGSRATLTETEHRYLQLLSEAHGRAPTRFWVETGPIRNALARQVSRDLTAHVERTLSGSGEIRLDGGRTALTNHDPFATLSIEALERLDQIETALGEGGLTPPDPATLARGSSEDEDLIRLLVESGRAVSLRNNALRQTLMFHPASLDAAFERLRRLFPPPLEFTTGEARAALGTSRKFIVPVLEYFDTRGLTARVGDVRHVVGTINRVENPNTGS